MPTAKLWERFADADNACNEIYRQRILDEANVHASGVARYVHMVYDCAPWLVAGGIDDGNRFFQPTINCSRGIRRLSNLLRIFLNIKAAGAVQRWSELTHEIGLTC